MFQAIPLGHGTRDRRRVSLTAVLAGMLAVSVVVPHLRAQAADPAATLLADYRWRSIGPAAAGGRITGVEALDDDFRFAVVAAASDGVWKTTNAGTTWTPIFDHYGSASIGDIKTFRGIPGFWGWGRARPTAATPSRGATAFTSPRMAA